MRSFTRTHLDRNQPYIAEYLQKVGCSVTSLASVGEDVPDLLVGYRRKTFLLEIKNPARNERLTEGQSHWHLAWSGGIVATIRTLAEALIVIGYCDCQTIPIWVKEKDSAFLEAETKHSTNKSGGKNDSKGDYRSVSAKE